MKQAAKQIVNDVKERVRFLKYKKSLPDKPNNSDLYIVEFPKSGITWFSTIMANSCLLESGLPVEATHFNLEQIIGDVHQTRNIHPVHHFPFHRIIKSHDYFNPYYRHVIYLIRNPFSVMNSYYHFVKENGGFDGTIEEFVKHPQYGVVRWVQHVQSWVRPEKYMKMHVLRYEDLKDDTSGTIKSLFRNLGWDLKDSTINESIERSGFSVMKELNDHYIENCPFRKYDFVREGNKQARLSSEAEEYIYRHALEVLEQFFPELLERR